LVFLHAVKEGPASRSYGLQVAQLAGVPRAVIGEARRYMAQLEAGSLTSALAASGPQPELPLFGSAPATASPAPNPSATPAPVDELRQRLAAIDPDQFSPRDALALLYELRRLAHPSRS
ncbi:MAG: MutS-related protein, partial [Steroidobacteraceae bacterium]